MDFLPNSQRGRVTHMVLWLIRTTRSVLLLIDFNRQSLLVRICAAAMILFAATRVVHAAATAEAYSGLPFGVARVTIDVLRGEPVLPLSDERFTILEGAGRTNYPVLKQEPIRQLLRGLLEMEAPRKVTIYFLFRGDKPFDVSCFTPGEQGVRIRPADNSARHRRLLNEWWEQYTKRYQSLVSDGAYPPVAENFIIAQLSRRLGLEMPSPKKSFLGSGENAFEYLFVNEAHSLRIDREMLRNVQVEPNELVELPEPRQLVDSNLGEEGLEEVDVEPLARHVPEECFYVRFGSFLNYLWFRDLNKKWQGDLGNMIRRRGIERGAGLRIQQQLSLKDNVMAKFLGPQVIGDAALIGLDPYVGQGAAIGLIFQAKNEFLLSTDLLRQRRESLTKFDDATEETIEVAGQSVSLISNPTGEVRSYHAKSDGVHLVATSRTLVERFLQAGKGNRPLAELESFRRARQKFPLSRDDTVFAFFSERFWQNLGSPQYVIENYRRLRSTREAAILELAHLSAQAESLPHESVEELIKSEILPDGFGARFDDSEQIAVEGQLLDSLRGKRGFYVSIADTPVAQVSSSEIDYYQRVQRVANGGSTGGVPPIAAAVHRETAEKGRPETVTVDVCVQGSVRERLGKIATWIGQPSETRLRPVAGDLISLEAVVEFPGSLADSSDVEQHLFGALRDFRSPLTVKRGALRPGAPTPELVRGYVGAWPKPGLLQWLTGADATAGAEPQPAGADMWQAKRDDMLLISFKPDIVNQVLPQLERVPAERRAQAWLQIEDLTGTEMSANVNMLGYMRTRDTSVAGSRMMNSLANQLKIPRPDCRDFAEQLVDGKFVCPLGGEYQLYEPKRGLEVWASSALPEVNRFLLSEVPDDFELPMLQWFRGLRGDAKMDERSLDIHLEIQMTEAALP